MHGYLSSKESFYYQTQFFSQYYRATALDFAGFGISSPPDAAYSVGDYADWLADVLGALKIYSPHIVCHSFGARVAFKLLGEKNYRVDKLVVTGGAGLVKPRSKEYIRRVKAYRRIKKLFPKYAESHFGSEEYRSLSPVMKESYKKIVNEDLLSVAGAVKNKTLLVYGREDGVTPPNEEGEAFRRAICGSQLRIIEGGHFCFSEYPDLFNQIVLNFLTE